MNDPISMQITTPQPVQMGTAITYTRGECEEYITRDELAEILESYVTKREMDNGSIVRWKGGQRNVR